MPFSNNCLVNALEEKLKGSNTTVKLSCLDIFLSKWFIFLISTVCLLILSISPEYV